MTRVQEAVGSNTSTANKMDFFHIILLYNSNVLLKYTENKTKKRPGVVFSYFNDCKGTSSNPITDY